MDEYMFKRSQGFIASYWFLILLLVIRFTTPLVIGGSGGEVGVEGYMRVAFFGVLLVFLLKHISKFSFIYAYESLVPIITLCFLILVIAQFFILNEKMFNLQGSVKFLFYLLVIVVSLYSAIIQPDYTIQTLLSIALFLFLLVLIFYPYLIVQSGLDPLSVLLDDRHRMHFLVGAANEDAHFMTTLYMLVVVKLRKYKFWQWVIAGCFYIALLYNGTRSALVIALLLPIIYHILYTRKFMWAAIFVGVILITSLPYIIEFVEIKFEREIRVLENPDLVLSGEEGGGSFAWRIVKVWRPMIEYTLEHSPIIGNGSNGWDIVRDEILYSKGIGSPHNTFVWTFVNWGILGIMGFLLMLFMPLISLWQLYIKYESSKYYAYVIALICAWIEFIVWSSFANAYQLYGWAILCILYILSIAIKYVVFWENDNLPIKTSL